MKKDSPRSPQPRSPAVERLSSRILEFVGSARYQPQEPDELINSLGIGFDEQSDFHDACRALLHSGRVVLAAGGLITLPAPKGRITGTFRANQRGFGFVIPLEPNAHADLFIPPDATAGAMTGDTVIATLKKRGKRGDKMIYEGAIAEIVRRSQSRLVGELKLEGQRWFVIPNGQVLHGPVFVGDPGAKGAKEKDQVVVEITQYPTDRHPTRGVITKILGKRGDPGVDALSIIEQYELPSEFPELVLEEARSAALNLDVLEEIPAREDLRDLTIITIDPVDARDFDDAISITPLSGGQLELGVHIADVSHFVPENGPIDDEARTRSTSVYFPGLVIPMLPEILSNGVCSLQEREPRLTKSAFITYDRTGNVVAQRFANTVIASTKRLAYEHASAALEGKGPRLSAKILALLELAEKLARTIFNRRMKDGMLRLDLPEVQIVLDQNGRPTDVRRADTSFSHTLIEMFMVEANEAVARGLAQTGVPFLRRIHQLPSDVADSNLRKFLKVLGHPLPARPDRMELQRLLEETRGTPESFPLHLAVLRSMSQAEYSPAQAGHFALASEEYCHFTSPIRRYPDLTIHRLFEQHLAPGRVHLAAPGKGSGHQPHHPNPERQQASGVSPMFKLQFPIDRGHSGKRLANPLQSKIDNVHSTFPRIGNWNSAIGDDREPDQLSPYDHVAALGKHCSISERRAEAAERELKLVMSLRLLQNRLGQVIDGTITSIATVGLFVQLDHYLVDGLLAFDALADDWWEIDESRGFLVGRRSGRKIKVGDRLPVVIARINIPARKLDLALAGNVPVGSKVEQHRGADRPHHQRSGGKGKFRISKSKSSARGKSGPRTKKSRRPNR